MKFEDYRITHEIKKSIARQGWKRPTDIQFKSIPPILKGEDVLAIAQTGTGKTAAFVIPIVNKLHATKMRHRPDGIKCVVMAPTRELALQISEVFDKLSRHTKVKVLCVHGGVEQDPQIAKLEKGIDVLVATPGRVFDLVHQGHIRLNRVGILVLDEADQMLDLGFYKDIQDLIRFLPKKRQTLFFSATIDEKIKNLAYSLVNNPIRIQISPKDPVSKNVDHSVAFIEMDDKRFFLERLVKENPESKILVFVRTKVRAERVCKAMERVKIKALTIHGDKDQQERFDTMQQFKAGKVKILIATDVTARGIDIPDVEFVANYDLPEDDIESYVHRVGRTGRGKQKGIAISFCSKDERDMLKKIEDYIGKEVKRTHIDWKTYTDTLDFSDDGEDDWRSLMKQAEKEDAEFQEKKSKKKKKKKK